jgi:DNA modification methylase
MTRARSGAPTMTERPTLPRKRAAAAPRDAAVLAPPHAMAGPDTRVYCGDCRETLPRIREAAAGLVDLVFADPPFNWNRAYDRWDDSMPREDYLDFTYRWLDLCVDALTARGSIWVNIPDDTAAEIVVYLKGEKKLEMANWCVWHYRFGQNTTRAFINSKVHALYFTKDPVNRVWNPQEVLEASDRASTYFDPRTLEKKDGMPAGQRVPMDVWYGPYWGRIQGNNKERRAYHDNQLPEVYLERVIRACTDPGMLVLDPFLGSGTTGVVARALGRRFIGCEFSPENAASAFERIGRGPVRLGAAHGASSAIHKPRAASRRTRERFE